MKIDLARLIRRKPWSEGQIAFLWTTTVFTLVLLMIVDLRIREPFRVADVAVIFMGTLIIWMAFANEKRGYFRGGAMQRMRVIRRDREPDRFRHESNGLIAIGLLLSSAGLALQVAGWYLLFTQMR